MLIHSARRALRPHYVRPFRRYLELLHPSLVKQAGNLSRELEKLQKKLSDGKSFEVADQKRFSELSGIVDVYQEYEKQVANANELREMISDETEAELREEAQKELEALEPQLGQITADLKTKLLPAHPFDEEACILELRPGVGGGEAAIFAKNLLDMYSQYAHYKKWKYHIISETPAGSNGIIAASLSIDEPGAYKLLKFEKGIHRVQRIPETESKGRVHTSTAAVVVLPKISKEENLDADQREFKPDDIRIDVMRSRGKGGQHVNTTDSAVRITHYPSGIVVSMQDERSQHRNKAKAFAILRARLAEKEQTEKDEAERKLRTSQVTSTDRSDKIRTYNYSQNRITDHRCGYSLHDIEGCMNGTRLEELIIHVEKAYNEERSKELAKGTGGGESIS